jgi:HK97 gp10 family phage protein
MGVKIEGLDKLEAAINSKKGDVRLVRSAVRKHGAQLQSGTQSRMAAAYTHGYSTGATSRSTTVEISNGGLTATVAPHTKYFPYLEYGTRFMSAMPTLGPAFRVEGPLFIDEVKKIIEQSR